VRHGRPSLSELLTSKNSARRCYTLRLSILEFRDDKVAHATIYGGAA
jgi:hypothetical protein